MNKTSIEWADYTVNPIRARAPHVIELIDGARPGWSCVRVSQGCKNCYAATLNKRFGTKADYTADQVAHAEHYLDEKAIAKMLKFRPRGPFKNGRTRPAVFVQDMADLFGEWVKDEWLDRLIAVFEARREVDWVLLTKRPKRMRRYMSAPNHDRTLRVWPPPNVWLGVSVENQAAADERIPILLDTPAAVHFLSVEPLLEGVRLGQHLQLSPSSAFQAGKVNSDMPDWTRIGSTAIDWVIVGGESGPRARPFDLEWAYTLRAECDYRGAAFFLKQIGSAAYLFPRGNKGNVMDHWPEDLRVRQMPGAAK